LGFGLGRKDDIRMYVAIEKSIEITVMTLGFEIRIRITFYPADENRCLLRAESKSKPITN